MHDKAIPRPDRGCNPPSSTSEERRAQRAVLNLVLDAHPKALTIPGLSLEIGQDDDVERAVVDLVGVGLLEAGGISVKPAPAAIRFAELELP